MYIEDYFDIVNTGERLYSVILDEDELRMFNEISSEEEKGTSDKKKKALKGAAVAGAGAAGGALAYTGTKAVNNVINRVLAKRELLKEGGEGYTAAALKSDPKLLKKLAKWRSEDADVLKKIKPRARVAAGLGAAAASYGAYKYLKNRNKKNNS